jgi:excisionase family DNA binding protein
MTLSKQAAGLIWTRAQAAEFLKTSERTIDRLRAAGRLPAQSFGSRGVRFLASDVAAVLVERRA